MTPPDAAPATDPGAPAAGLAHVRAEIDAAAEAWNRAPGAVKLIAVSKVFGPDRILPVLEAGHRLFGENKVQEALGKWPALKERFPDAAVHLIGPLQSNKTKDAVGFFDAIHSLDREKLARRIADEIQAQGRAPMLFVQVNTGDEAQKAGVTPDGADAFIETCRKTYGLTIEGLMCIPPADEAPSPHFALLRKIAERNGLESLSMGMSGDYREAVSLGATHVRVGSAIFGERPKPAT